MINRPYTLLSCAMSIDGYVDDISDRPVSLTNQVDIDRIDAVRASCDAVLVSANSLWRDNPSLLVRVARRREERLSRGQTESPMKIAVTAWGDIDPGLRFFTEGDVSKIVFCTTPAIPKATERLEGAATVVDAGDPLSLRRMLADIADRGAHRLLIEGGGSLQTQFLREGLVDELHLVVAPAVIGSPHAQRFLEDGAFPSRTLGDNARLMGVDHIGDLALLRYGLSQRVRDGGAEAWMRRRAL